MVSIHMRIWTLEIKNREMFCVYYHYWHMDITNTDALCYFMTSLEHRNLTCFNEPSLIGILLAGVSKHQHGVAV